ncbi:unnamed protein product, partial [Ectocarpus sp. 12 AP-2014]
RTTDHPPLPLPRFKAFNRPDCVGGPLDKMPRRFHKRARCDAPGSREHQPGCSHQAAATAEDAGPPDYSLMQVWDKRYQDGVSVEWYCGFEHVRPLFERFVPKESSVLEVGCGDKPLAWDLRDAGYTGKITSFDFSPTVIERLLLEARSCDRKRLDAGVDFQVLDARDLPFEDGSFDLVVDKGAVDAMLCDDAGQDNAREICLEAARVVAPGGWFVVVSHIHPYTPEGMALLSEVLVPGLRESSSSLSSVGEGGGCEGKEGEYEEAYEYEEVYSWSVDVHCADGDEEEEEEEEEEEKEENGAGGGRESGDGGGEEEQHGHGHGDGDERSASGQSVGPSAYMARKVPRRHTRSSASGEPQAIPVRIHEY